jgi:predicted nucleic acid-binding protein
MIHLDTSYLIRALAPNAVEDARLRTWIRDRTSLAISAICWTEFLCGPLTETQIGLARQVLGEPVVYSGSDAERAAELYNLSGRRRGSLVDCMVAAIALGAGASLATTNARDFSRFEPAGLQLVRS